MPIVNRNPLEDLSREMIKEIKKLTGKNLEKDKFSPEEIENIKNHLFPDNEPSILGKKILDLFKDIWFP